MFIENFIFIETFELIPASAEVSSKVSMKVVRLRKSALFYCIVIAAIPSICFFNYYHIYSVRRSLGAESVVGTLPQIKERMAHQGAGKFMRFRGTFIVQGAVTFNVVKYRANNFTGLLSTTLAGSLGEQMFQFACTFGIASMNNLQPVVTPSSRLMKVLRPGVAQVVLPKNQVRPLLTGDANYFNRNLTAIGDAYNTLVGRLRSWKYFTAYEKEIRNQFTFSTKLQAESNVILQRMYRQFDRTKFSTTVGVQVQRQATPLLLRTKHDDVTAMKRYLHAAMNHFRRKYEKPLFVIVTDDIKWAISNINRSGGDIAYTDFFERHSDRSQADVDQKQAIDILIMSRCNHTIITDCASGWWAAYLCEGEKVYPGGEESNDTMLKTTENIYPGTWTPLSPSDV